MQLTWDGHVRLVCVCVCVRALVRCMCVSVCLDGHAHYGRKNTRKRALLVCTA